jgi:uncharacterized protein (DUF1330 family)
MSAYLIVNYTVTDADQYGEYQTGAGPALGIGSDCELVVFDTASERVEGDTAGHQTVILKFESKEKAKQVYESGAYQAVVGTRLGATSNHFAVLVNGIA